MNLSDIGVGEIGPLLMRLREDLVEHFVTIDRIPDGLEFPSDLKDRFRFDAAKRRLVFQGFMSKAEFDRLCRLSDDWSFRRPLEDLFRLCTPEEQTRPRGLRGLVSAVAGSWLS